MRLLARKALALNLLSRGARGLRRAQIRTGAYTIARMNTSDMSLAPWNKVDVARCASLVSAFAPLWSREERLRAERSRRMLVRNLPKRHAVSGANDQDRADRVCECDACSVHEEPPAAWDCVR